MVVVKSVPQFNLCLEWDERQLMVFVNFRTIAPLSFFWPGDYLISRVPLLGDEIVRFASLLYSVGFDPNVGLSDEAIVKGVELAVKKPKGGKL